MKKAIITLFLLLLTTGVIAQDDAIEGFSGIANYYQRIILSDSASAKMLVEVTLAEYKDSSILIPLNYNSPIDNLAITGNTGAMATIALVEQGNIVFAKVEMTEGSLPEHITLTFDAPGFISWEEAGPKDYGNFELEYRFINTSPYPIKQFAGEVVLTDKFTVHNIVESLPKVSKNDPDTPYIVGMYDGKHSLKMTNKNLDFGDQAYVKFNIRKENKSIFLALAFLAVAVLYLVFFTDVLRKKVNGG